MERWGLVDEIWEKEFLYLWAQLYESTENAEGLFETVIKVEHMHTYMQAHIEIDNAIGQVFL